MGRNKWTISEQPVQYLLEELDQLLEYGQIRGDSFFFPHWEITLHPEVQELRDTMAVLRFVLECPAWDRPLIEVSAGVGKEQHTAVGMALGGFLFGMMNGVGSMMEGESAHRLQSVWLNTPRQWTGYRSNIVSMGANPSRGDVTVYWDLLLEDILARVGNQKMVYVKVYGAKNGDDITGECRINDIKNEALSQKVAEQVAKWDAEGFGSQKQFFYLIQRDETRSPYPYTEEDLARATRKAVALFGRCCSQEVPYKDYVDLLGKELGDRDLAEELYGFLPEFCAENYYHAIAYGEQVNIHQSRGDTLVYKSQIASYHPIQKALHAMFDAGEFSNELYGSYITVSSIHNVVTQAKEKGGNLEEGGQVSLSFGFPDSYRLR